MSEGTNKPTNIQDLFQAAHEEGDLSASSLRALTVQADIGAQIQAGLGIAPDDVPSSEVVLVTMMPDDSGSIRFAGCAEDVRSGHNLVLEALLQSRQREDVLVHTRYLNGHVLYPYRKLADAVRMNGQNYDPNQGTPLYDQTVVLLGTVLAKSREFALAGVPSRTVTLLLTDGEDVHSSVQTAASARSVVEDLLRMENHIIAAMGIGSADTFKQVFRQMGIPDAWILTPGNSQREIRKAFQAFSQSAVQASQGAAAFAAAGGFGN
jgi:hypothetical protein